MSEAYAKKLNNWMDENKFGYIAMKGKDPVRSVYVSERDQVGRKAFLQASRMRYLRSLVEPGEAVGLLASQG
jgi:DNA-directed RNA polymerase I subunit RPA1